MFNPVVGPFGSQSGSVFPPPGGGEAARVKPLPQGGTAAGIHTPCPWIMHPQIGPRLPFGSGALHFQDAAARADLSAGVLSQAEGKPLSLQTCPFDRVDQPASVNHACDNGT